MDQYLSGIGAAIAGFFGSPVVQVVLFSIAVYLVVLWLASAYWVFRDMQQRAENAILPYLAASFIIVFLPIFPLAVFVYKIVRPHEKIGEVYERNLAEEALLAEVEAIKSCPTCARRVDDEWIICPTCRTRLNRVCPNCSRLVGLDWSLCAWCGKDFERPAAPLTPSTTNRPAVAVAGISPVTVVAGSSRPAQIEPGIGGPSDRVAIAAADPKPLDRVEVLPSSARPIVERPNVRPRSAAPRSPRSTPDVLREG
jgi:RNA polymerase subunit RPABC4/transcription elongation factor Spt4